MGPANEGENGIPMPMCLEAFPGGRWYRDLGAGNGHCWGTVQAIRKPDLLEISGPLFMSYPVSNNVQYRLRAEDGGTLLTLRHTALGLVTDEHRAGVSSGWQHDARTGPYPRPCLTDLTTRPTHLPRRTIR